MMTQWPTWTDRIESSLFGLVNQSRSIEFVSLAIDPSLSLFKLNGLEGGLLATHS